MGNDDKPARALRVSVEGGQSLKVKLSSVGWRGSGVAGVVTRSTRTVPPDVGP